VKRIVIRVILIILAVLAALAIAGLIWYKTQVKPPVVTPNKNQTLQNSGSDVVTAPGVINDNTETNQTDPEQDADRSKLIFTFAVLGKDQISNSTDTIMVVKFDTVNYTLNAVSIPRDTLVNVSWTTKKVNTLYAAGGIERVRTGLGDILGFEPDFYVMVDLKAFETLVDAIGGVYYDVPRKMDYEDPAQNLYIHLKKGPQQLNGEQALGLMRFRKGYSDQDIGRIGTQQDFLQTVAAQILANKNSLNLSDLITIFINYVKTDLTYGELIWLGQEFYKMDMENIHFETLPGNYNDYMNGTPYVTIYVDEWLAMINASLNPFNTNIEIENLNILTRDPKTRKFYTTSGTPIPGGGTWSEPEQSGSNSGGNGTSTSTPKPSASPSPSAATPPSVSPSESPSASPTSPSTSPTTAPTETPSAAPSPAVSDTPEVSESPEVSASPDVFESPEVSDAPEVSESPDMPSPTPEETPEASGPPVSEEPTPSAMPDSGTEEQT